MKISQKQYNSVYLSKINFLVLITRLKISATLARVRDSLSRTNLVCDSGSRVAEQLYLRAH